MSAAWRTRILSLAGRIILENGGETYRAEDTVTRMARAMGMTEVDVFGIPSGLFISYTDECGERETSVCRIFFMAPIWQGWTGSIRSAGSWLKAPLRRKR